MPILRLEKIILGKIMLTLDTILDGIVYWKHTKFL